MKWFTTTQFGIELETLIIVPQTRNILIKHTNKNNDDNDDEKHILNEDKIRDIRMHLSLYH
jgi:hypothetical protein